MAEAKANTEVNINMVQGNKVNDRHFLPDDYGNKAAEDLPANITDVRTDYVAEIPANGISVIGYYVDNNGTTPATGVANGTTTYYKKQVTGFIKNEIGTIGNVFGGGRQGKVSGNATVNIGTSTTVPIMSRDNSGNILATDGQSIYGTDNKIRSGITIAYEDAYVLGAHIDGDVFGGGNEAVVTGNTVVKICTEVYSRSDFEGISIDKNNANGGGGSVYGGGRLADVLGNTNVTMSGGYVFNGIFGGGYAGSVGDFTRSTDAAVANVYGHETHDDCIGKPVECKSGGTCTVVVDGGQIGPVEVATVGMRRMTDGHGDPVPEGWVWGGGRGLVVDPSTNPDMHFQAYVNETDVTIGGTAFILESVIGGGEFGRVLGDTKVTIKDHCQIGVGEGKVVNGKPVPYDENEFINPLTTTVTTGLPECSHYPYGKDNNGKKEYLPYDPYYDKYKSTTFISDNPDFGPASTDSPSDGKTWIGCVFGGGSGYYPYEMDDGPGYDWCRSAGWVEGNTEVIITGGHILTNVYGGNEYTDVGTPGKANTGKCVVKMSGGTIGVPRTLAQIADHPIACNLFGAGKGDERSHFRGYTNVNSVEVDVSGGIIYGSVFGGSEDGHVLGDVSVTIRKDETNTAYPNGPIIGTWGTSYMEGNVFGAGRGFSGRDLLPGSVGGNTKVTISGGTMRGSVYGGGRLASVGINLNEKPESDSYGQLIDETGNTNDPKYGHITIDISGGTIGTTTAADSDPHPVGGNVFGGSMGRITLLNGEVNPLWPKMAVAKLTDVKISGNAEIMNNVYGGSEYGVVRNLTTVNVSAGTIHGHVFGGGYGSDEQDKTTIKAGGYSSIPTSYYTFTPMIWTGCVSGNTNVNISGGQVKKNVYGGGEYASVGLINFNSNEDGSVYNYITKHESLTDGFGLSWPYEFQFIKAAPNDAEYDAESKPIGGNTLGGKATVNITGGRIGTNYNDGTGYVFGGSKGQVAFKKKEDNNLVDITDIHEQRYTEAFCANVRETEVNIKYKSTPNAESTSDLASSDNCIVGAVYGGGEDGHVYENAAIKITNGLIGLSVYGGGKGESTYTGKLLEVAETVEGEGDNQSKYHKEYEIPIRSWTAGKVYGNTSITMNGGHVMGNVYGGGNLASVGKGNYSGGADDYYPAGYGETLQGNLWDNISDNSKAFMESGKATITITAGKIGTVNGMYGTVGGTSDATPTGMVFGGSRGRAAQDVSLTPRYDYAPDFYLGYTNNAEVTIGNESGGPTIYSQVFGGGRDGHVRGSTHVIINNGIIGQLYNTSTDDYQRYHRGNVYGSGSGLGLWDSSHHGSSSGSVTRNTKVDIYGGTIYNNVYGGGAMSSVGPPRLPIDGEMPDFASKDWTSCEVNIHGGTIGIADDYEAHEYGGCVFGASRGGDFAEGESYDNYATTIWNVVNIEGGTIAGNVYGGGRAGLVKKDTEVNLKGGRIAHDAYGGGMGTLIVTQENGQAKLTGIAADIGGNTTVELNKDAAQKAQNNEYVKGCVVDRIFGCNDMNGTPKGHATVHVYATQNKDKDKISAKIAPPQYTAAKGENEGYKAYLSRLISEAAPEGGGGLAADATITAAESLLTSLADKSEEVVAASNTDKNDITTAANNIIAALKAMHDYDVKAVYGGGDLAMYDPDTNGRVDAEVIIEGCAVTSIKQVYGGGNAAPVPSTRVDVKSCFIIDELFGGGNGNDNYQLSDGKWYENPGANVGYRNYTHHDTTDSEKGTTRETAYPAVEDATTPEAREAYRYGGDAGGYANTTVNGGHIHTVYGGSNMKGNIYKSINLQLQQQGSCPMITDEAYSSSKSAETDASSDVTLGCVEEGGTIYGGSFNANLNSDVNIFITNGHYNKIFGGNNQAGTISGKITITVDESGCSPVRIDELYAGGYLAPYSIYGYSTETYQPKGEDGSLLWVDEAKTIPVLQRKPYLPGDEGALSNPYRNPQINIISATEIGAIYGGGYKADLIGSPHINVNMKKGMIRADLKAELPSSYSSITTTVDGDGNVILPIGDIGTIYGGGNKAKVIGDTFVEIGTGTYHNNTGEMEEISPARYAAHITGDVFGGGNDADVTGDTHVIICAKEVTEDETKVWQPVADADVTIQGTKPEGEFGRGVFGGGNQGHVDGDSYVYFGGGAVNQTIYGGGCEADVHGNTHVTMLDGYVEDGVCGGGLSGSVGTIETRTTVTDHTKDTTHDNGKKCLGGKPEIFKEGTGKCTVVITGGQVGPATVATEGMTRDAADGGPVSEGWVWGAGRGVVNSPDDDPDTDFRTYVYETDVTIGGTAFIMEGVVGGGEFGRVRGNTWVKIQDHCQIGVGAGADKVDENGKPIRYSDGYDETTNSFDETKNQFIDPATTTITNENALAASSCFPYGRNDGTTESPKWVYDTYDPYADEYATNHNNEYLYPGGSTNQASDGRTWIGCVFAGGSGYFPYKTTDADGKITNYDWLSSAGLVEGDAKLEISGGHILTNAYGGNEYTNIKGTCTVKMSGGTIGVPRTLDQIKLNPMIGNLFGAGKGDPRVRFNKETNVGDVDITITGGIIYGSVFGGGEDGHVLRNVTMTIGTDEHTGPTIGSWGTSYFEGNVFGGGRGFTADAYTAGNVAGSIDLQIKGGTMLGSVYGGGRLGSVGYGLYDATTNGQPTPGYGEMRDDHKLDNDESDGGFFTKGRGHVNITISGGTIGNKYEFVMPATLPTDWTAWKNTNHVPNTDYDTSNGRVIHTKGGNVYAGGMGRFYQLDGTTPISAYSNGALTSAIEWSKLGNVKSTKLTISGADTWIMGNVYGGGELGAVTPYTNGETIQGGTTTISITGGTIGTEITADDPVKTTIEEAGVVKYTFGSVYGGGMGQEKHDANDNHGGEVKGDTKVGMSGTSTKVRASVFGGGEMALVGGDTYVTISGGEIGRNEVQSKNGDNPGYVKFGGATMGNVFGAGKGSVAHFHTGQVKGNTNVTINAGETAGQPFIYHNVYGGGALASVGTFELSTGTGEQANIPAGIPYGWANNTGTATVTINGGTIGINGRDNGMVDGSSRGDIEKPTGTPAIDRYDKVAWVNNSVVTIGEASGESAGPHIMGSVYGGGENGHNAGNATVTVNRGTIGVVDPGDVWYDFGNEAINKKALITRGNVYGAGCGTDMYDSDGDGTDDTHNPKSGMVAGNTFVTIAGGHVGRSVYGGGSMGSVGTLTNELDENYKVKDTYKNADPDNGFALSWPYKFVFKEGTGKATVNITGGHIGTLNIDGGDVFGGTRGEAGDRYTTAHLAYVGETEVNIDYPTPSTSYDELIPNIKTDLTIPCVTGAVSGSGEDGYVYGDTHVTLNKGLIGHSLYGGGKGKGTYKVTLNKIGEEGTYESDIYSLIAGKVFGNTYVTMNDGFVGRNVYGGGNMASVGKGNYASGADDYFPNGYGEKITGNLWDGASDDSKAFLNSGKTTVKVFGGTVGYVDKTDPNNSIKYNLPYGNVFGGSAGEAAPNVPNSLSPRYHYCPAFFSGYVNETDVNIGGYRCKTAYGTGEDAHAEGEMITAAEYGALSSGDKGNWEKAAGPTIIASVYGGGQDGHVRRDAHVTVTSGEIGLAFTDDNRENVLKTKTSTSTLDEELKDEQWLHRGNVYGAGSGISEYKFNLNGSTDFDDTTIGGFTYKKKGYSTSAGSVTRFTQVDILGGTIHRNVYGGGSMGSIGPLKTDQDYDPYKKDLTNTTTLGKQSQCTVNIGGAGSVSIGSPTEYKQHYGGEVYGACRGRSDIENASQYAISVWTKVLIKDGATIQGNVFGGGDAGVVKKDTDVQIGEPVTTP